MMPVVLAEDDELRHIIATSEDDAEYEEDDEIPAKVYIREQFRDADEIQNSFLGSTQLLDSLDAEMAITSIETVDREDADDPPEKVVQDEYSELDEDEDSAVSLEDDDDDSKDSTDTEADDQWVPEPEEDDDIMNPNCCIYCHQDEENDPSEEFELYLSCGVCGDNAHRQCARNADALKPEDEANAWYCSECVSNDLVQDDVQLDEANSSPRMLVSKERITDNLLISQRDNPMNDLRLRRKRKNFFCIDADAEDSRTPRRHRRDKGRRFSNHRATTPKRDVSACDPMDVDPAESHDELHLKNDRTKKLEQVAKEQTLRPLRSKSSSLSRGHASIIEKSANTLKILIKVDPEKARNMLSQLSKTTENPFPSAIGFSSITTSTFVPSAFLPSTYSHPLDSLHDREADELKSKPYGGILTEEQADTSLTLPRPEHRRQFDEARQKAEEDWKARAAAAAHAAAASGIKKPRKVSGPASKIEYIEFGNFQIDIWYAAPYPEEYSRNKALFICEFCLKYMESDIVAWRHTTKCPWKNPPGDEIYRDGQVAVFEVDGRKNPLYCQNLCLLAKLFLGSKTLYYDVEPFLFYVMTEYDKYGCHFVGYFSKEKRPSSLNNVSCILVLPIHQRKGYGHLLIDFSYLLTRVEKKTGSPEKPLSDMGLVSYRNYWRLVLCTYLKDFKPGDKMPSIRKISSDMGLTPDDVISALDALGALIRDPASGTYAIKIRPEYYQQVIRNHESKNYAKLNPKALFWTPYVMGRWNISSFDNVSTLDPMDLHDEDEKEALALRSFPANKRNYRSFSGSNPEIEITTESQGQHDTGRFNIKSPEGSQSRSKVTDSTRAPSYYEAAASIPPTCFEVFPPLLGTRGRPISRPISSRPTPARQKSSLSASARSTPRRFTDSSGCPTSSNSRGKSGQGGTNENGRGVRRCSRERKKIDSDVKDNRLSIPLKSARSRLSTEITSIRDDKDEDQEFKNPKKEDSPGDEDCSLLSATPSIRSRCDPDSGQELTRLGKPTLESLDLAKGLARAKGMGYLIQDQNPLKDQVMADAPCVVGDVDTEMDSEGEFES